MCECYKGANEMKYCSEHGAAGSSYSSRGLEKITEKNYSLENSEYNFRESRY